MKLATLFFALITTHAFASDVVWDGDKGINKVFVARCMACHSPAVKDKPNIVNYDVAASLCGRIFERAVTKKDMPAFNNATRMTDEERALVATWINNGAPKSATSGANPNCKK